MTLPRRRHVVGEPLPEEGIESLPHRPGRVGEYLIHEELVGEAIEGHEREQGVAAFDEDHTPWTYEGAHVAQRRPLLMHMREDPQSDERIEGCPGPKGHVGRGVGDVAPDDCLRVEAEIGHSLAARLHHVVVDL